jgi:3-hydroxyisobutyrate dehydrogenase-like beta-hydroxyacid dehydrogenase
MNQECEHVSFVGLGPLGAPLALQLLQGIQETMHCSVFDPLPERMEPLAARGAEAADQLGTVAHPGSIVFTMIPDDRLLLHMALGEGGLLKQLGSGGVHISLAPISPHVSMQLEKLYQKQGSTYLAATVLGYPEMAHQREVVLCLAGETTAKKRVLPLLMTMSHHVYDLGKPVERATIVHTAATTLRAVLLEALGEMAALGEVCGMKRGPFLRWLLASPLLQGHLQVPERSSMAKPNAGEMRYSVEEALQAVELAIQMGQEHELDLPCADVVYERLLLALEGGRGGLDWTVLSTGPRPGAMFSLFDSADHA